MEEKKVDKDGEIDLSISKIPEYRFLWYEIVDSTTIGRPKYQQYNLVIFSSLSGMTFHYCIIEVFMLVQRRKSIDTSEIKRL